MTQNDKVAFVYSLTAAIAQDLVQKILRGDVPHEWDGIELRELLADKFRDAAWPQLMKGKRKKEYKNDLIIFNL